MVRASLSLSARVAKWSIYFCEKYISINKCAVLFFEYVHRAVISAVVSEFMFQVYFFKCREIFTSIQGRTFVISCKKTDTIARLKANIYHILYEMGRGTHQFRLRFKNQYLKDVSTIEVCSKNHFLT